MHCVSQTPAFVRAADSVGMSEDEIDALVDHLARNPMAGDEIPGTGGCRKLRWAGKGVGKRGAFRTITFYTGSELPVYLITVFAKGEKANLTQAERNKLGKFTKMIVDAYRLKVVSVGEGR
ncbi:type II toxin-antitoxin system RelE/ParE family toxin [Roseixanthobacter pseudopolyaromaticivorans]|uniref:type II toxin-antitoxin system RelE/ParE family toxin n=1 Tax=Xanthobacteraceae TaxID=335928 RepID=UPI00372CCAFD